MSKEELKIGQYISLNGYIKGVVKCVNSNCKKGHRNIFCVEREDGRRGGGCNGYWLVDKNYSNLQILGETNPNSKIIVKE